MQTRAPCGTVGAFRSRIAASRGVSPQSTLCCVLLHVTNRASCGNVICVLARHSSLWIAVAVTAHALVLSVLCTPAMRLSLRAQQMRCRTRYTFKLGPGSNSPAPLRPCSRSRVSAHNDPRVQLHSSHHTTQASACCAATARKAASVEPVWAPDGRCLQNRPRSREKRGPLEE